MEWVTRFKDYIGGTLMLLLGIGAMVQGQTYAVGTLSRMGPGYFPVALGAILAFIGVALLISARLAQPPVEIKPLPPEWRGWICIILGVVAFSVVGKYGGLVPATVAIVFISAMGERQNTWLGAAVSRSMNGLPATGKTSAITQQCLQDRTPPPPAPAPPPPPRPTWGERSSSTTCADKRWRTLIRCWRSTPSTLNWNTCLPARGRACLCRRRTTEITER